MVFSFSIGHARSYTLELRRGGHYSPSLGIQCRYDLAKNLFKNIQHCVHDPATLSTP